MQWAILTVLLLTLASRGTTSPTEAGSDSFELHMMAEVLIDGKGSYWFGTPLSPFGAYPLTYPIGVPVEAASLSAASGLDLGTTMTVLGALYSVLAALGMMALSHGLLKRPGMALAAGTVFALSNNFSVQSTAGVTGRVLFMALVPLVVLACWWILSRPPAGVGKRHAFVVLAVALLLVLLAAHRLSLFAIPFLALALGVYGGTSSVVRRLGEARFNRALGPTGIGAVILFAAFGLSTLAVEPGSRQGPGFLSSYVTTLDRNLYAIGWLLETVWNFGPTLALLPLGIWAVCARMDRAGNRFAFALLFAEGALLGAQSPALTYWCFAVPNALAVAAALAAIARRAPRLLPVASGKRAADLNISRRRVAAAISMALIAVAPSIVIAELTMDGLLRPNRYPDRSSYSLDEEALELGLYLRHDDDGAPLLVMAIQQSTRLGAVSGDPVLSSLTAVVGHDPSTVEGAATQSAFDAPTTDLRSIFEYFSAYKTFITMSDPLGAGQSIQTWSHWVAATQLSTGGASVRQHYNVSVFVVTAVDRVTTNDRFTRTMSETTYVMFSNALLEEHWIRGL